MRNDGLRESELYQALGALTKDKSRWKESIPYVSSLLAHESVKIQAKSLWLLGEMGLAYPLPVQDAVPAIASFLDSPVALLRERAVNALGRIGGWGAKLKNVVARSTAQEYDEDYEDDADFLS